MARIKLPDGAIIEANDGITGKQVAEKIGAVNTLVIDHRRKIRGFNTDGPGFLSHLTELNFDLKGKRIAYVPSWWGPVMWFFKRIPECVHHWGYRKYLAWDKKKPAV